MVVTSDSFLLPMGGGETSEPFEGWYLDTDRLARLVNGPEPDTPDVDVAVALLDLVRDELHKSGTGGTPIATDTGLRLAMRALQSSSARAGHEVTVPFHDHKSWKLYWTASGAVNYAARRAILSELFDEHYAALLRRQDNEHYAALLRLQDKSLDSTLLEAVSADAALGWPDVDTEISELRRLFRDATTPQDYAAVGLLCVRVTEALSRQVYDHSMLTPAGEPEPKVAETKTRLDRYIVSRLPGSDNERLRGYVRKTVELAQEIKHRTSPTQTEAGISADAVIALGNLLRRLDEER
ncbi:MAG: hypothetical protein LC808_01990 [Actinobacteria bacterium]|nr:hypothetical protein [Actinomycetota bacterium]